MPDRQTQPSFETAWQTFAGTIRQGMEVIGPDGKAIGRVIRLEGELMRLYDPENPEDDHEIMPLSLIDGISGNQVLLARRGDATFGLGAEP